MPISLARAESGEATWSRDGLFLLGLGTNFGTRFEPGAHGCLLSAGGR
jgi:hypothetical protein